MRRLGEMAIVLTIVAATAGLLLLLAQGSGKDPNVVARIGDQVITAQEVDAVAAVQNMQAYQQLYAARKAALEQLLLTRLIEIEAASLGISVEELIEQEINQKAPETTDAEVEAFYTQNQARMQGRSLDEARDDLRSSLIERQRNALRQQLIGRLRVKHEARILLDPPRAEVEIAANDPSKGPESAPIQIIAFSEFQ